MRDVGHDGTSAAFFERACSIAERAGRVNNIVRDDAGAAGNITDDVHDFCNIGARTTLVDDSKIGLNGFGHGASADNAAHIRRNYDRILKVTRGEIREKHRRGIDVIDGDVEEALNLVGVEVHCEDVVNTGGLEHVGNQLGRNGHAG